MSTHDGHTLLFVYGTLKRGCSNHREIAGQEFVGEARTTPGFGLVDLGGYPAIVPRPENRDGVAGEVWSVDPAALARLDHFEGVHEGLYRRATVMLQPPFADREIEAYFSVRPVEGLREVGSRWIE
jgi:gamma-glutamylaminecyclotransferase